MRVMRVDWNPVSDEQPIVARFFPVSPRPKAPEPKVEEAPEDQAQAKVVRTQRRKGPRASTGEVFVK